MEKKTQILLLFRNQDFSINAILSLNKNLVKTLQNTWTWNALTRFLKNGFVLSMQRSFAQEMYAIFIFEGDDVIWSGIPPENPEYAILAFYEPLKPVVFRKLL